MTSIIQTIRQNCRRCYSCVRACPAKAIRIVDGQASVVTERCIACGNCTLVCSQNAKAYASGVDGALQLLASGAPVAALVAPSFPADPLGADAGRLAGALAAVGFRYVVEVAYGADLVSAEYARLLAHHERGLRVATACPAVVDFVRKYNPDLVDCLVPIVSPMIATALAVRAEYGDDVVSVFIGPCIAKKVEARDPLLPRVVHEVLTFEGLGRLFTRLGVSIDDGAIVPREFDAPRPGLGRVFPLAGGLLKAANLERNVVNPDIVVLTGHDETPEVLASLSPDQDEPLLVEAMMCKGCYSGPGLSERIPRLARKRDLKEYVRQRLEAKSAKEAPSPPVHLDLSRHFTRDDVRLKNPGEEDIRVILARTNKFTREDELNCGACGYDTCRAKAIAVYRGLAEEAMCLPFMIEQAERVCHELKVPWPELREVHRHLINAEKLASLGQMAAGVAHELNNPLGAILLYTGILARKLGDRPELSHDVQLLVTEAQRCKKIIGSLLDFARQNRLHPEKTLLSDLFTRVIEEVLFAIPDGLDSIRIACDSEPGLEAHVDRDQIEQVLVNLVKNSIEAMAARSGTIRLTAVSAADPARVRITVQDEGCGIAPEARDKVFQPFFTTKGIGKGTGLGLPIAYGIVKMHSGAIWFDSEVGRGTTFIIELPKAQALTRSPLYEQMPHDCLH